jgi:predicted short-subunit dehydrogenase-like oxidoreductase (DUF2520 family)
MQGAPTPLALIGLGSVGLRLALAWQRAGLDGCGYSPGAASRERARAKGLNVGDTLKQATAGARCIIFCVEDTWLAQAVKDLERELEPSATPICLHTCGSRGVSVLSSLAAKHCPVGTFHPLTAFSPHGPGPVIEGTWCAIGGDPLARAAAAQLATSIGARTFSLVETEEAALRYHAAATLLANGTVALTSLALELARGACLDPGEAGPAFLALLAGTVANLQQATPEKALTGPVSRGDAQTVRAHLHELARDPAALAVYRNLSRRMLELARRDGRFSADQARAMERLLAQ